MIWGKLDYLIVDLPPGTGDVPITVMQSLPLDGVVVVSSPQDVAAMIVRKAMRMASMMKTKILGLIENMSYAICPKCGEVLHLFGPSKGLTLQGQQEYRIWEQYVLTRIWPDYASWPNENMTVKH